ncbi:hypothetical protein Tco_1492673 [Tanacetum coccineum]
MGGRKRKHGFSKHHQVKGRPMSIESLNEASELVKQAESPYGIRVEGDSGNEMVLEWNGAPVVKWRQNTMPTPFSTTSEECIENIKSIPNLKLDSAFISLLCIDILFVGVLSKVMFMCLDACTTIFGSRWMLLGFTIEKVVYEV